MNLKHTDQQRQQLSRFIKRAIVLFVLIGALSPSLAVAVTSGSNCIVIINGQEYVTPGCTEYPDPSSPGLGI